jgi:CheY-like chemotaxis protein
MMSRILIVEDGEDAREVLASFLKTAGHSVDCVSNGREALHYLMERLPDLVILDIRMEGMNGLSLLQVIRSYLRLQSIPVIVWTAMENGDSMDKIREYKVHSILTKGKATLQEILSAIKDVLKPKPA